LSSLPLFKDKTTEEKEKKRKNKSSVEGDEAKKPQEEAPKDAPEEGTPKGELKPKVDVRVNTMTKAGSKGNVLETSPLLDFTPKKLSLKSYQEWEDVCAPLPLSLSFSFCLS
jgi:hypothetical protein